MFKLLLSSLCLLLWGTSAYAQLTPYIPQEQQQPPQVTPEQVEELRAKAEAGDVRSQGMMGDLYTQGMGVERSLEKAFEWYKKAADGGDAHGTTQAGLFYMLGDGVKQDYEKGRELLEKTADEDPKAAFNLGVYYLNIANDNWAAMKWIEKASEQGYPAAVDAYALLNKDLKFLPGESKARYPLYKKVSAKAIDKMATVIQEKKGTQCNITDNSTPPVIATHMGGTTLTSYKELWLYSYCNETVIVPIEFTLDVAGETSFEIASEFISLQEEAPDQVAKGKPKPTKKPQ